MGGVWDPAQPPRRVPFAASEFWHRRRVPSGRMGERDRLVWNVKISSSLGLVWVFFNEYSEQRVKPSFTESICKARCRSRPVMASAGSGETPKLFQFGANARAWAGPGEVGRGRRGRAGRPGAPAPERWEKVGSGTLGGVL